MKPNDSKRPKKWPKESSLSLQNKNAYYLVLEASKTRLLCFVDKVHFVVDLRACVVPAFISKRAYALHSLSSKEALERGSEAFHLMASPLIPHPTLSFLLKLSRFWRLIDWILKNLNPLPSKQYGSLLARTAHIPRSSWHLLRLSVSWEQLWKARRTSKFALNNTTKKVNYGCLLIWS